MTQLTHEQQQDRLSRNSANSEVRRAAMKLHLETGGKLDQDGNPVQTEKEYEYKSDYIGRMTKGHAQGGSPHVATGSIPVGKEKEFARDIVKDIYYMTRERNIVFSTEIGMKFYAGISAHAAIPKQFSAMAVLTNNLEDNEFRIEIENGVY